MLFNTHSANLVGQHAFLSPSKYHWINYDEHKLDASYTAAMAARRGSEFHDLAATLIRMGVKLSNTRATLNQYVNDALGYRMTPEQLLFYSPNAFGTCDAISFRKNKLRIHDLKMGITTTSVNQLKVYAAFFCLEYNFNPNDIEIELRIYQNNEVRIYEADPTEILYIMEKTKQFDRLITAKREEDRK